MVQYFWLYVTAGLGIIAGFCAGMAIGAHAVRRYKLKWRALVKVVDLMEEQEKRAERPA